jgi:hypothetical protein
MKRLKFRFSCSKDDYDRHFAFMKMLEMSGTDAPVDLKHLEHLNHIRTDGFDVISEVEAYRKLIKAHLLIDMDPPRTSEDHKESNRTDVETAAMNPALARLVTLEEQQAMLEEQQAMLEEQQAMLKQATEKLKGDILDENERLAQEILAVQFRVSKKLKKKLIKELKSPNE